MIGPVKTSLLLASLAPLLALLPACSEKQCPTIACVPRLEATFINPIADPYRLSVVVNVAPFAANCPMVAPDLGLTPGIQVCDARHFVVTGVDLGHDPNVFVNLTVSINSGSQVTTNVELRGITNSLDCDLVCYQHAAIIQN
jgi:hypothetical protein